MPTIKNRKKDPISIETLNTMFQGSMGVKVEEYHSGIAKISSLSNPEVQWWVDVKVLIGDTDVSFGKLSSMLNKQIPNRKYGFIAF